MAAWQAEIAGASRPTPASSSRSSSTSRTRAGLPARGGHAGGRGTPAGLRRRASSAWRASTPGSTSSHAAHQHCHGVSRDRLPRPRERGGPAGSSRITRRAGRRHDTRTGRYRSRPRPASARVRWRPSWSGDGRAHGRQNGLKARALADGLTVVVAGAVVPAPVPPAAGGRRGHRGATCQPHGGRAPRPGPADREPPRSSGRGLHGGAASVDHRGHGHVRLAAGAGEVLEAVRGELATRPRGGAGRPGQVVAVGCSACASPSHCSTSRPRGLPRVIYGRVTPGDVPRSSRLISSAASRSQRGRWAPPATATIPGIPRAAGPPVMRRQVRIALRNCGVIDPANVDHYLARGGYAGLRRALWRCSPRR